MAIYWIFIKHYAGQLLKYPWQIACALLAIIAYFGWSNAEKWEARTQSEKVAHAQTVTNYRTASELARKANLDQVAAIEAKQTNVIQKEVIRYVKVNSDYRSNLSDRMRAKAAPGGSDTGKCNIPVISEVPGGIVRDTETAIISREDAEIVAENQAKLEALIAAWRALE